MASNFISPPQDQPPVSYIVYDSNYSFKTLFIQEAPPSGVVTAGIAFSSSNTVTTDAQKYGYDKNNYYKLTITLNFAQ